MVASAQTALINLRTLAFLVRAVEVAVLISLALEALVELARFMVAVAVVEVHH